MSHEILEKLLYAAFSAPTAANGQPWEFVVIDDEEVHGRLRRKLIFADYKAPAAIVVCGNNNLGLKGLDKDSWICDCSAAMENMLLPATDMGLGSPWCGAIPGTPGARRTAKARAFGNEAKPKARAVFC